MQITQIKREWKNIKRTAINDASSGECMKNHKQKRKDIETDTRDN